MDTARYGLYDYEYEHQCQGTTESSKKQKLFLMAWCPLIYNIYNYIPIELCQCISIHTNMYTIHCICLYLHYTYTFISCPHSYVIYLYSYFYILLHIYTSTRSDIHLLYICTFIIPIYLISTYTTGAPTAQRLRRRCCTPHPSTPLRNPWLACINLSR